MKNTFFSTLLCVLSLLLNTSYMASAGSLDHPTVITGKVLGSNGKPMLLAHVLASQYNTASEKPKMVAARPDGSYSLSLPPGWHELSFAGVNHQSERTMGWVYCCGQSMTINARLQANSYRGPIDSVTVITDLDDFNFNKARAMTKQSDGTFAIDVSSPADRLVYQVIVYTASTMEPHSINGTMANKYEYDGGGDYRSYIDVHNGQAHIVFDPKQVAFRNDSSSVEYIDSFSKTIQKIVDEQQQTWATFFTESARLQDGQKPEFNPAALRSALRKRIMSEKNEDVKHVLMMSYLSVPSFSKDSTGADPKFVDYILKTIEPSDPIWMHYPNMVLAAVRMSSNPKSDYALRLVDENMYVSLKAQVLYTIISDLYENRRFEEAKPLYDRLTTEFRDTYPAAQALRELRPNRKIAVGNMIPKFEFESLEDSTIQYIPETLKGRWVLIDNWATWCGPCVAEMAALHKAHENFKDKKFTILSVSYDRAKSDVERFRKAKWPMPWLHCFSAGVWQNEASKIFEVNGIPKPILVDPDGRIVALDSDLRGPQLEQTLQKFIK